MGKGPKGREVGGDIDIGYKVLKGGSSNHGFHGHYHFVNPLRQHEPAPDLYGKALAPAPDSAQRDLCVIFVALIILLIIQVPIPRTPLRVATFAHASRPCRHALRTSRTAHIPHCAHPAICCVQYLYMGMALGGKGALDAIGEAAPAPSPAPAMLPAGM